jgi:hypothetical protein
MQKEDLEKAIEKNKKMLDEQIAIFDKVASANRDNPWGSVYGPLRNLFTIAKAYLELILEQREEIQKLTDRVKDLEGRK